MGRNPKFIWGFFLLQNIIANLGGIGPADAHLVVIAQRSEVAPFAVAGEVFEGRQRDQGRAMHAGEASRIEPGRQRADAQVAQVALRLGIEFRVVAGGFDPEDVIDLDGHDLVAAADEESVEVGGLPGL